MCRTPKFNISEARTGNGLSISRGSPVLCVPQVLEVGTMRGKG